MDVNVFWFFINWCIYSTLNLASYKLSCSAIGPYIHQVKWSLRYRSVQWRRLLLTCRCSLPHALTISFQFMNKTLYSAWIPIYVCKSWLVWKIWPNNNFTMNIAKDSFFWITAQFPPKIHQLTSCYGSGPLSAQIWSRPILNNPKWGHSDLLFDQDTLPSPDASADQVW